MASSFCGLVLVPQTHRLFSKSLLLTRNSFSFSFSSSSRPTFFYGSQFGFTSNARFFSTEKSEKEEGEEGEEGKEVSKEKNGPLHGLRVLDISRVLAGPHCTQLLADLGSDVIKIERPIFGDDTRHWGPPYWPNSKSPDKTSQGGKEEEKGKEEEEEREKMAAYFLCANRGKRSVVLDMASPSSLSTLRALADKADVIIENYKVGSLKKYKMSYEDIKKTNPKVVYCSITGYGQTGPRASLPGYDFLAQAMGGLMSITGTPEAGPLKVGVAVTDILTGMYASVGILSALRHRDATGEGQHLDLSLFDCQLSMLANQGTGSLVSGKSGGLMGNSHPSIVPYQAFMTSDRSIVVAVGNDSQFKKLCEIIGLENIPSLPSFSTNKARVENRKELQELIQEKLSTSPADHWVSLLEAGGVPVAPILSVTEALNHPQAQHREMVVPMASPFEGDNEIMHLIGNPIKMSECPSVSKRPPPLLGQHTEEVLKEWLEDPKKI